MREREREKELKTDFFLKKVEARIVGGCGVGFSNKTVPS